VGFILVDHDDQVYRRRFDGKVTGKTMEGTARGDANAPGEEVKWRATKQ